MLSRITRNLFGLLSWLVGLAGLIVINGIVVSSNYVGTKIAFELLGFEQRALHEDELMGWFFAAVAPEATLAHLFALGIALTVATGVFLAFRLVFSVYHLWEDRQAYLSGGGPRGPENAKLAARLMVRDGVLIVLFLIPLLFAASWDIELFRFRSIAGSEGIELPEQAVKLLKWDLQMNESGHLYAWSLARWGAWGYIAVTTVACLGLEYAFLRVSENWSRLTAALEDLFGPGEDPVPYGYDENGEPVYDETTVLAYDIDGNPIEDEQDPAWVGAPTEPSVIEPGETRRSRIATAVIGGDGALFEPPALETAEEAAGGDSGANSPVGEDPRYEVIGGLGQRVTRTEALAASERYHVDVNTFDIWERNYWELIHGPNAASPN